MHLVATGTHDVALRRIEPARTNCTYDTRAAYSEALSTWTDVGPDTAPSAGVMDLRSLAILELSTYTPNGARENLYVAPSPAPLEPMGFTGKESDEELGMTYFGERWLIPRLGRWASPDPLHVHASGGGEALNSYHYVSGNLLQARDPLGLDWTAWRAVPADQNFQDMPMRVRDFREDDGSASGTQYRFDPASVATESLVAAQTVPRALAEGAGHLVAWVAGGEAPSLAPAFVARGLAWVGGAAAFGSIRSEEDVAQRAVELGAAWVLGRSAPSLSGDMGGAAGRRILDRPAPRAPRRAAAQARSTRRPQRAARERSRRRCSGDQCGDDACFVAGTLVALGGERTRVEDVEVGSRVVTPNGAGCDGSARQLIRVELALSGAMDGIATLLRDAMWVETSAFETGSSFALDDNELGRATATVLALTPVHIEAGEGCLVTGWVEHPAVAVVSVGLATGEVLRTTPPHPFYVVERATFVAAGELAPGEHVLPREGAPNEIVSIREEASTELVYNLEVEGAHTYLVGETGVWVHNTCGRRVFDAEVSAQRHVPGVARPGSAAGPINGQAALDTSLSVGPNTFRRVGVDRAEGEFVVFDAHSEGQFHSHVRTWRELDQQMQAVLRRGGLADRRGRILPAGE